MIGQVKVVYAGRQPAPRQRQGFTTFQGKTIIPDVVHLVAQDNIQWGSDYPHPDGVWPDSAKVIQDP